MDRRGRVHLPAERRQALLEEFARSGVSAPEFCRLAGLHYGTFAGWRARQARVKAAAFAPALPPLLASPRPQPALTFLEALVETPVATPSRSELAVELPGGARLLIGAAAQLPWAAELLQRLSQAEVRPC